ncbi:MAG: helix-turn-helix domain-containing protein [Saprospiraceae bacterium]
MFIRYLDVENRIKSPLYYRFVDILKKYIHHISASQFLDATDEFTLVVPDAMTELVINLGGPYFRQCASRGSAIEIKGSHFIGFKTKNCFVKTNMSMKAYSVRFLPGAIKHFTKFPLSESINEIFDASLIFGTGIKELEDKLFFCRDNHLAKHHIEDFLMNRFLLVAEQNKSLEKLQLLYKNQISGENSKLKDLGFNYKSMERVFLSDIGITPKMMMSIIQFNHATKLMNQAEDNILLTQIAYQSGYYDQAHFIRSFQKFSGNSPSQYLKLKNNMITFNQEVINSQF